MHARQADSAPPADDEVEIVVAHRERATVRVGAVFLKVDPCAARVDAEVAAMALAPVPTPAVLWRRPPVLALSALRGSALGRLGEASSAAPTAWSAAGAAVRLLHDAPLPPWPSQRSSETAERLDDECLLLVAGGILPAGLVERNRRIADAALRPRPQAFIHGDLHLAHVFTEDDRVTGVLDWSEAGAGDPAYDLAVLALGHDDRLGALLAGYGAGPGADLDAIRGWQSARCLLAVRWLAGHGLDPFRPGCEVDVLRSRM
jgi:aminoglycoside phosphotransferase (APT) family kinase protein